MTGRRLRRPIVGVVVALAASATLAGCQSRAESPAGLLVVSGGSMFQVDDAGRLQPVDGAAGGLRHVAAAGRSLVAVTNDDQFLIAAAAGPSAASLAWRPLEVVLPADGFTTGIDISPDGHWLAVVRGHDDADRLELVVADLAKGAASMRSLDVGANGPPSWLTNDNVALEVVDSSGSAELVSVNVGSGDGDVTAAPDQSRSRGFAIAATADGRTIAVADDAAGGVVVRDRRSWWAGDPGGPGDDPPAADEAVQDVAIDADGTRLAVVYAQADSGAWGLAVYRLRDGRWETVLSTVLESEAPPTIDWLE